MRVLCFERKIASLDALKEAVGSSSDIAALSCFESGAEALHWAEINEYDIAFLEASADGMELARQLMALRPGVPVIFCAEDRDYAFDAIRLHASGYLLKPVTAEAVQRELDHIIGRKHFIRPLVARCFGDFQVFGSDGKPLVLRRARSKELLAILIDRRGAVITSRELCALLWGDKAGEDKLNYLHQLIAELRRGLSAIGAEAVLQSAMHGYRVDTALIDCDYYHFLVGDKTAQRSFLGEYMSNYDWAEYTNAYLISKYRKDF